MTGHGMPYSSRLSQRSGTARADRSRHGVAFLFGAAPRVPEPGETRPTPPTAWLPGQDQLRQVERHEQLFLTEHLALRVGPSVPIDGGQSRSRTWQRGSRWSGVRPACGAASSLTSPSREHPRKGRSPWVRTRLGSCVSHRGWVHRPAMGCGVDLGVCRAASL
jgi:hypothetical protein